MSGWEMAELDADRHRNIQRAARQAKREARFWPPAFGLVLTTLITIAAGIQGGAIHV